MAPNMFDGFEGCLWAAIGLTLVLGVGLGLLIGWVF